jgi:hypothetical protein
MLLKFVQKDQAPNDRKLTVQALLDKLVGSHQLFRSNETLFQFFIAFS